MSFWLSLILAGIGTGCIYSLAGMGIVLTYKATGIFNFAHGAIAMFVAYILWQLNSEWHISLAKASDPTPSTWQLCFTFRSRINAPIRMGRSSLRCRRAGSAI